jgi:hypothetical protein
MVPLLQLIKGRDIYLDRTAIFRDWMNFTREPESRSTSNTGCVLYVRTEGANETDTQIKELTAESIEFLKQLLESAPLPVNEQSVKDQEQLKYAVERGYVCRINLAHAKCKADYFITPEGVNAIDKKKGKAEVNLTSKTRQFLDGLRNAGEGCLFGVDEGSNVVIYEHRTNFISSYVIPIETMYYLIEAGYVSIKPGKGGRDEDRYYITEKGAQLNIDNLGISQ